MPWVAGGVKLKKRIGWGDASRQKRNLHLLYSQPTSSLQHDMAPPDKVTADQKAHLINLTDSYLETKKSGGFAKYWASVYEGWFELWPEQEDKSLKDANERKEALTKAIRARQKVSEQVQVEKTSTLRPDVLPSISGLGSGIMRSGKQNLPRSRRKRQKYRVGRNSWRPILTSTMTHESLPTSLLS